MAQRSEIKNPAEPGFLCLLTECTDVKYPTDFLFFQDCGVRLMYYEGDANTVVNLQERQPLLHHLMFQLHINSDKGKRNAWSVLLTL